MIAFCEKDDLDGIRSLYNHAFNDSVAFTDYYFNRKIKPHRVMGIKDQGKLVSMVHLNPYQVVWNHETIPVSYYVAVATREEYRGKGLMGELMKASMRYLYQEGEPFALLMPVDSRIYERYGFGFIEEHLELEVRSASFTHAPIPYECRVANEPDAEILSQMYGTWQKQFGLSTKRNLEAFADLVHEIRSDQGEIQIFEEGYMMTYYEDEVFHIREMVVNSGETLRQMLSFIQKETGGGRVVINEPANSLVKAYLPNIHENVVRQNPFMMGRILNVKRVLEMNHQRFIIGSSIKVRDLFIDENNGIFDILEDGVSLRQNGTFDMDLDIKTLTQLVFSYWSQEQVCVLNGKSVGGKPVLRDRKEHHFFNEFI